MSGVFSLKSDGVALQIPNVKVEGRDRKPNIPGLKDLGSKLSAKFINVGRDGIQGFKVLGISVDGFLIDVQHCR